MKHKVYIIFAMCLFAIEVLQASDMWLRSVFVESQIDMSAQYAQRLLQVRKKLPFDPAIKTYLFVRVVRTPRGGDMWAINYSNSGVNKAMHDLGFKTPNFVQVVGENYIAASELYKLNQDILLLTTIGKKPMTGRRISKIMSAIRFNWDSFVPTAEQGNVIYIDANYVQGSLLQSAINMLDYIEWHYNKKREN